MTCPILFVCDIAHSQQKYALYVYMYLYVFVSVSVHVHVKICARAFHHTPPLPDPSLPPPPKPCLSLSLSNTHSAHNVGHGSFGANEMVAVWVVQLFHECNLVWDMSCVYHMLRWFSAFCIYYVNICDDLRIFVYKEIGTQCMLQGSKDPQDALSVLVIFRKKSRIISGSFAKNDLQLKAFYASSPPCIRIHVYNIW